MSQLSFTLPEINREETKKRVEEALEKYRILLLQTFEEELPKLTANYSFLPPSKSNVNYSNTENIAVKKADYDRHRKQFLAQIHKAVNRLSQQERSIIINRYMSLEEAYDYEIYNQIGMSERKYYRVKTRAFYKLALILKIEVYADHESVMNK
ncbi:ArpU family phage packaging/lysis transcriptional regulator [Metabacillus indicus]|uniref:ArpU family phage packaging/lysis transcriptional regulator n=1 Tax=Metabacillus indicus TaxID=246786 RepID=UPI002A0339A4|nr:ArpU family phage packaging/lysis transcriptional regulator [Metabacillus indicus]MDX8291439.1 ArpU family phage packaging/lysis transcriptional regulator [Metabacillus indicus]